MQLTNQQTLPVGQSEAWAALNDIPLLQKCIPGCDTMTSIGPDTYELGLLAAVGPVRARFKGKLLLEDIQAPDSYSLKFEGQGGAAGHGKGSAKVWLQSAGPAETVLHYSVSASVGGKLAQIGSRLVDMAAEKMAADFFAAFKIAVNEKYPSATAASQAGIEAGGTPADTQSEGVWRKLRSWFALLFSSKGRI